MRTVSEKEILQVYDSLSESEKDVINEESAANALRGFDPITSIALAMYYAIAWNSNGKRFVTLQPFTND